ncbi:MAG: hypothetical protein HZC37_18545 [Burkholderiales bacterium]|nr:hypothetical protein [Burkholderiales bacterium]
MDLAASPLLIAFVVIVTLWPIVFLGAVAFHSFARRWRRAGQVALLLPLWMIAASIGLVQVPPFIAALAAPSPTRSLVIAGTASAFALCCAILAWALLLRSFGGLGPSRPDR